MKSIVLVKVVDGEIGPFDAAALDAVPAQFYASRGMGIHSIFIGEIEHVWLRNREGEQ